MVMKNKISKYIYIDRIEFVLTWQCGGKCKHCQVGDDINKTDSHRHVLSEYAVEAVKKLSSVYNLKSVMTFGGEPLHYPEVAAAIHKAATDSGIETRQIITNGYFTNNADRSKAVAKMLADAGVNNLLISIDAFHQEYIPIEPVYRFVLDVIEAKVCGAFIYPAWLINKENQNPYNEKTKEILEKFSDLSIRVSEYKNCVEIGGLDGNAVNLLRDYCDQSNSEILESNTSEPCQEPLNITNISIVPNGDVMVCEFVIGNIYTEDIIDIIARYDPYENESMCALIQGGVAELLSYAKKHGVMIDTSKHYSNCDVCHTVVKCLKQKAFIK